MAGHSVCLVGWLLLSASWVHAQVIGPSETVRQQNLDENAQWQRALERQLKQQLPSVGTPLRADVTTPSVSGERFLISHIELQEGGDHVAGVNEITRRYEGTRMGSAEIFTLLKELNHFYYVRGYVTTYVSLLSQNLTEGALTVVVNWGRVKGWLLNGKPASEWKERLMLASALPGVESSVLNVHDIDQAIENLHGLGQTAKIDVVPTEESGYSLLDVVLERSRPYSVTASLDNSGLSRRADDGVIRYGLDLTVANVLGLNDALTLSGSRHYYSDAAHNAYDVLAASYGVRVGRWSMDARVSESLTKRLISGVYGDYESSGNTLDMSLRASRMLGRWQTGKVSGYVVLDRRHTQNYIDDHLIAISSNVHTNVTAGLNGLKQAWGGAVVGDVSWTRGVGLLGATLDPVSRQPGAISRYDKINLRLNWSRDFQMGGVRGNYAAAFGAQYSKDPLFYDAKFTIGDEYTVRGFKPISAYGDSGAYVSNTVSLPYMTGIGQVAPFVGLDYGAIHNNLSGSSGGAIAGTVLGLRYANRWVNASVAAGKPLKALPGQGYDVAWYLRTSFTY